MILKRIKPDYLVLIEHSVIAESIFKFYKKQNKIPSKNVLKQEVLEVLESRNYVDLVTKEDIPNINKIIEDLFNTPLVDRDYIQERIYQFSTYVEMKNLNDSFDLDNFEQPTAGMLTPYSAIFIFSIGVLLSNFIFNTLVRLPLPLLLSLLPYR